MKEVELTVPINEMSVQQIKKFIEEEFMTEVAEKFEGKLVIHSHHFSAQSLNVMCPESFFFHLTVNYQLAFDLC